MARMMGIGTAANFNLNLGTGNEERARRVAGTGLSCLALFSLTLGLIALFFRGPLLNLFGATPEVLPYAMIYTGITAFGLPMVTFTTGASSLVRADGSPTYSMLCTLSGAGRTRLRSSRRALSSCPGTGFWKQQACPKKPQQARSNQADTGRRPKSGTDTPSPKPAS